MKFKIKNTQIRGFADFLLTFELKGKQSRLRTRFVKLLDAQLQQIQEEIGILAKEHCHLDDEGNPKIIEHDGSQHYDIKDMAAWNKDVHELYSEYLIIQGDDKKEMLEVVRDAVLECDRVFSGQEALDFDSWCELVEGIEE